MIDCVCQFCEKEYKFKPYPSKRFSRFCSRICSNRGIAKESARLRGDIQRGRGEGKTYTKLYGRHMHRVVIEDKIGRKLSSDEIVHHIDGNKKNNDVSNLQIVTRQEHCKIHFTKPVRYCSIEECHNKYHCKTYCRVHYDKIIRKR